MTPHPDRRYRSTLDRGMAWATIVGVAIICCTFLFGVTTLFWPFDVFESMAVKVEGPVVAGQTYRMEMTYCKIKSVTPKRIIVTLQNDITIVLYNRSHPLPIGCHTTHVEGVMPPHVPAGTYIMEILSVYQPFPWRQFSYQWHTPPFKVLRVGEPAL
jgi:hypothetical protein